MLCPGLLLRQIADQPFDQAGDDLQQCAAAGEDGGNDGHLEKAERIQDRRLGAQ